MTLAPPANNALLTYAVTTDPSPLQASPGAGQPTVARLIITVSCPVDVTSPTITNLLFQLPIGDPGSADSADLSDDATSILATVDSYGAGNWRVTPGGLPGLFNVDPDEATEISSGSLAVTFSHIAVSGRVGPATISIVEKSQDAPTGRAGSITVAKFPSNFEAGDFAPLEAAVMWGETATLRWTGSTADYTLTYGDQTVDVSPVRDFTTPQGLTETTTFTLTASVSVGGETVTHAWTTTVTVQLPAVKSGSVDPPQVDQGSAATLTWQSEYADGVYLLSGTKRIKDLPTAADPQTTVFTPARGYDYFLQAYKRTSDGSEETTSGLYPLEVAVNAYFRATPTILDAQHQRTLLEWNVWPAQSVTLGGVTVESSGNTTESPSDSTTYELSAVEGDGSTKKLTVDVTVKKVSVGAITATWNYSSPSAAVVTVSCEVQNAISGTIRNVRIRPDISFAAHTNIPGAFAGTEVSDGQWRFTMPFNPRLGPPDLFPAEARLDFEYTFDGLQSLSAPVESLKCALE